MLNWDVWLFSNYFIEGAEVSGHASTANFPTRNFRRKPNFSPLKFIIGLARKFCSKEFFAVVILIGRNIYFKTLKLQLRKFIKGIKVSLSSLRELTFSFLSISCLGWIDKIEEKSLQWHHLQILQKLSKVL